MMPLSQPMLCTIFLVAIRLSAVLVLTPIQAIRQLPIRLRLIIVFIVSTFLVFNLSLAGNTLDDSNLLVSALAEFFNGLTLAMSLYAAFAVFQIAGQLIDTQMGLNSLAIFNPSDHSHEPLSGHLLGMLALLFFFAFNGHHRLIQGLAYSFHAIPPGEFVLFNGLNLVVKQFSLMFCFALMIASPVVTGLLIVDLSAAILTRNMPQLSIYFLTLPIKILFGFFLLALSLNYLSPLMDRVFKLCFQSWREVMA